MTATLNLPVCVRVCEYAKLVSKYALKVSQRIGSLFFCFAFFVISVFILKESKDQKLRCKFATVRRRQRRLPYAKFTQIAADNAKEERERARESRRS